MDVKQLEKVTLETPPAFHFWLGQPQTGGFGKSDFEDFDMVLREFASLDTSSQKRPRFIETGAGLSTLWFLCRDFEVMSFSLSDVLDNMKTYFTENAVDIDGRWTAFDGTSETLLIKAMLELGEATCDIALIDGNHAMPSVFSDFVGLNLALKQGGLLLIDDLQLPGPALLKQLLDQSPVYWTHCMTSRSTKWACYRKEQKQAIMIGNMDKLNFTYSATAPQ